MHKNLLCLHLPQRKMKFCPISPKTKILTSSLSTEPQHYSCQLEPQKVPNRTQSKYGQHQNLSEHHQTHLGRENGSQGIRSTACNNIYLLMRTLVFSSGNMERDASFIIEGLLDVPTQGMSPLVTMISWMDFIS